MQSLLEATQIVGVECFAAETGFSSVCEQSLAHESTCLTSHLHTDNMPVLEPQSSKEAGLDDVNTLYV